MPEQLIEYFPVFASVKYIFLVGLGVVIGIVIGALPGLTVTMSTALLVSITFGWNLTDAMFAIVGLFVGGVSGACIGSVFVNIPGTPAAIATSFDGYPLSQMGRGGEAIGLSCTQSFLGTVMGILALALAAPIIGLVALKCGPPEFFLLVILGLALISSLAGKSMLRGLVSASLGLALSFVGMDPIHGIPRLTYGSLQLAGGIHFIPVVIGLLGMSEVLYQLQKSEYTKVTVKIKNVFPRLSLLKKVFPLTIRSGIIGTFIGSLPGVGGEIANLVAYSEAKRTIKNPTREFGTGAFEGVVAPEVANNACIGGAWIPLLTLGIPGDSTTAVILGALFIHGLRPGPLLLVENPEILRIVVSGSILASFIMVTVMLTGSRFLPYIVAIPKRILMPIVVVICVLGTYALELRIFHVYQMFAFGITGLVMRRYGFPVGPMVLAIILGGLLDVEIRRSILLAQKGLFTLFMGRPLSLFLIFVIVFSLLSRLDFIRKILRKPLNKIKEKVLS